MSPGSKRANPRSRSVPSAQIPCTTTCVPSSKTTRHRYFTSPWRGLTRVTLTESPGSSVLPSAKEVLPAERDVVDRLRGEHSPLERNRAVAGVDLDRENG